MVVLRLGLTAFPFTNLQHSWEMVGKKKGVSGQKDSGQTEPSEESKENRERDRDFSRRRGGPPRRGRGASRGRECMHPLPFLTPSHPDVLSTLCWGKSPSCGSLRGAALSETHPWVMLSFVRSFRGDGVLGPLHSPRVQHLSCCAL